VLITWLSSYYYLFIFNFVDLSIAVYELFFSLRVMAAALRRTSRQSNKKGGKKRDFQKDKQYAESNSN
jgi:hypothetical protein